MSHLETMLKTAEALDAARAHAQVVAAHGPTMGAAWIVAAAVVVLALALGARIAGSR